MAAALVAVVGLLAGAGTTLARYDPLEAGGEGGTPGIGVPFRDVGDFASGGATRIVTYVHGARFGFMFGLTNGRSWGVTIDRIAATDYGLFHVTDILRGIRDRCCVETEPFAPFALGPGEDRMIVVQGVMRGCRNFAPGSGVTWDTIPIHYRVLGFPRVRDFKMNSRLEVQIPNGYRCPEGSRTR